MMARQRRSQLASSLSCIKVQGRLHTCYILHPPGQGTYTSEGGFAGTLPNKAVATIELHGSLTVQVTCQGPIRSACVDVSITSDV